MRRRPKQLPLSFPNTHGGKRPGAGRKPKGPRSGVSHKSRPVIDGRMAALVTLRMHKHVFNLRSKRCFTAIRRSFALGADRFGFRLIHYSVQGNHIHLIVEAANRRALSRGAQGLSVRIAHALNRVTERKGRVFSDRYHSRPLRTPRAVRHALHYTLSNARRHGLVHKAVRPDWVDPYSSAVWFNGWHTAVYAHAVPWLANQGEHPPPTSAPQSWLLRVGWRRHGLLDPSRVPGPATMTGA